MPPSLALFLCVCFIVWLFWLDMRQRRAGSWGLLVPGLWVAILGSRSVGRWFNLSSGATSLEGNPVNLCVDGALILASLIILQRRAFAWGTFARSNKALILIYAYLALTSLWSFFPIPSLKRIVKDFGSVLMVLVILTEHDPFQATKLLFVRCSYVLFPLSVVFIKYFPKIGRMPTRSWETMSIGVTNHKNTLGVCAVVFGIMLLVDRLELRVNSTPIIHKARLLIRYGLLLMGAWLLLVSDSKTSLLGALICIGVLWGSNFMARLGSPRRAMTLFLAGGLCLAILETVFDISGTILTAVGRDKTLTGRTEIWQMVLEQKVNPLIGCGFSSFWDSPLVQDWNDAWGTAQRYETSHNGYLETYVSGGMLGILLLILALFAGASRVFEAGFIGSLSGRVKLAFFVMALTYNFSESCFFTLGLVWFVLLLAIIQYPPCLAQFGALTGPMVPNEEGSLAADVARSCPGS